MKTILIFALSIVLFSNAYSQSGWQVQNSNYNYDINDIVVANDTAAVCVGGNASIGHVIRTLNSGNTWTSQAVSTSTLNSIGYTTSGVWVVGDNGKIFVTINGITWTALTSGVTSDLNDIQFPSGTTGYTVGNNGVILKTTNGLTWSNPVIGGADTYNNNSVYFTSTANGVIAGDKNTLQGFAKRTVNGSLNFGAPLTIISVINDLHFINATTGFAAAKGGNIFKTTNSGQSWLPITTGTTQNINSIHFSDATNGYAVGDNGLILKTINGGTTWTQQNSPNTNNLNSVYCLNNDTIYAAGENGTIIKTVSAGAYLELNMLDETIYCNNDDTLVAIPSYTGNGNLTYTWSTNGPTPIYINSGTLITGNLSQDCDYYCTVTDGILSSTDTVSVHIAALPTDSICLVTVDDSLGHNVVVFERRVQGAIDYYKIYAESSVANVYDSIGFLPADSVGIFEDTISNPAIKSYSYKIAIVDSCGNESVMSNFHKTMHLSINQGAGSSWNLIWNHYEGIPIQTYIIWRADQSMNWVKIDSVGGLNTSYTNLNAPTGALYYQVEIVSPYICQPYNYKVNTNYNTSRSNTVNNGIMPISLTAEFSATPTAGIVPISIDFIDESIGNPNSYLWDFGDGYTSTDVNPTHYYTVGGVYTVKLVISKNTEMDSLTKVDYIDILYEGIFMNNSNINIDIYPNPITNGQTLNISHKGIPVSSIIITNILGKEIINSSVNNNDKSEISLGDISQGVYFVNITDNSGNISQKKFIVK